MPSKRRHTLSRSPILRAQMWISKVDADTYSRQLNATKPLVINKIAEYQSIHEYLISVVKGILERFGKVHQTHEYMWYASRLYGLLNTYHGKALIKEATAVFLAFLIKGLDESILRVIAQTLGIKIGTLHEILEEIMAPILIKIIKQGTIMADGTEQTILEYSGDIALISGYIDLSNMDEGDKVVITTYTKLKKTGNYILYHTEPYYGKQERPTLYILPRVTGVAMKITIKQEQGTYKNFDYLFVKGT